MPSVRRIALIGCLTLCTAAGLADLSAVEMQQPQVAEVIVQGAERLHPDRVRARLATRAGAPLDRTQLADDVRAIHEMRAFTGIRTEVQPLPDGRVRVIFVVNELPYVGNVSITGVPYFTRRSLRTEVRTRRGQHLDPQILERDRRRLLDALQRRRFLHATVTPQTQVDPDSGIANVVFVIDRREKVQVARVLFDGMPPGAHPFFIQGRLTNRPGTPFDEEMLEWDSGAVAQYLNDQGFLDAKVTRVRHEFFDAVESWEERYRHGPQLIPEGKTNNRVVITYFVDPGPRYRLRSVRFLHDPELATESELRSAFTMSDGDIFRRQAVDAGSEAARRVVANRGHARARIEEERIIDPESNQVDLTLRLLEGSVYHIGRVDPDGNTVTRDQVIRRAISLRPGDLYNQDAHERSRTQIVRTGIFRNEPPRPVTIDTLFDPQRPDEVDLRVRVAEDDTGRFTFQVGWSSAVGIVGQVSYEERNFDFVGALIDRQHWRGGQQTLGASVSWSQDRTSASARFLNPRVLDSNYYLSLGFRRTDDASFDWDEVRLVPTATIGRYFFDRDLLLSLGYSYTHLKTRRFDLDAPNDALLRANGRFHENSLILRQIYDARDNPAFPTSGLRVSLEQSMHGEWGLSASNPYYELTGTFSAHIPLFESELGGVTFLEFRQRGSMLEGMGSDGYVPFYARYRGGGPGPRHRGWNANTQGPRRENIVGLTARAGGTREVLSTLELNVPVQGTNRGLRAVFFADFGHIWDDYRAADDQPVTALQNRASQLFPTFATQIGDNTGSTWEDARSPRLSDFSLAVGGGIRLPAFLPIALDLAYVIDPKPGQSSTVFHFSISGGF